MSNSNTESSVWAIGLVIVMAVLCLPIFIVILIFQVLLALPIYLSALISSGIILFLYLIHLWRFFRLENNFYKKYGGELKHKGFKAFFLGKIEDSAFQLTSTQRDHLWKAEKQSQVIEDEINLLQNQIERDAAEYKLKHDFNDDGSWSNRSNLGKQLNKNYDRVEELKQKYPLIQQKIEDIKNEPKRDKARYKRRLVLHDIFSVFFILWLLMSLIGSLIYREQSINDVMVTPPILWSEYQGHMDWNSAKTSCKKKDMRLPNKYELMAIKENLVTGDCAPVCYYWTGDLARRNEAIMVDMFSRKTAAFPKSKTLVVRCVSLNTQTLYITTKSGLNLRSAPSTKARVYLTVPYGAKIEVLEYGPEQNIYDKDANWLKVIYKGKTGWLWSYHTDDSEP